MVLTGRTTFRKMRGTEINISHTLSEKKKKVWLRCSQIICCFWILKSPNYRLFDGNVFVCIFINHLLFLADSTMRIFGIFSCFLTYEHICCVLALYMLCVLAFYLHVNDILVKSLDS